MGAIDGPISVSGEEALLSFVCCSVAESDFTKLLAEAEAEESSAQSAYDKSRGGRGLPSGARFGPVEPRLKHTRG